MPTKREMGYRIFSAASASRNRSTSTEVSKVGATTSTSSTTRYGYAQADSADGMVQVKLDNSDYVVNCTCDSPINRGQRVTVNVTSTGLMKAWPIGDNIVSMVDRAVANVDTMYAISDSPSVKPAGGWVTTPPEIGGDDYLWQKIVTTFRDGTIEESDPVCLNSASAAVGVSGTVVEYAVSTSGEAEPQSGWSASIPSVPQGQYLWSRTTTTYSDGSTSVSFGVSYMGVNGATGPQGDKGSTGDAGNGISDSSVDYQASSSGTSVPTGPWSEDVPELDPGEFLWTRTTFYYTDGGSTATYSVSSRGEQGPQGVQGPTGSSGQSLYTWVKYANDQFGNGMSDNPDGKPYIGISYNNESATELENPTYYTWSKYQGPQGVQGSAGTGILSVDTTYQSSADGDTIPTGQWSQSIPSVPDGHYLWSRTITTYTNNGGSDTRYSVSRMGENGTDGTTITSVTVTYQVGTSGTVAPTGTWQLTVPDVAQNEYLWTRTVTEYSDRDTTTAYSVGRMGADGADGPSLFTWYKFADDDNGTNMSDDPTGKPYMGIAYNKDTATESKDPNDYVWVLVQGEAGIGIEDVREQYILWDSSTSTPGENAGWQDTCPEWEENHYIWQRTKIIWEDGSITYSPAILSSALNQANENAAKITWYVSSDDDGLHISSVKNNPNGGFNVLLNGTSMQFRDGTTVIGQYTGSGITFMGTGASDALNIAKDPIGTVYLGGDMVRLYFGALSGTMTSLNQVAIKNVVMMAGYSGDQITRCCSLLKSLTSSDSAITIGTTLGEFVNGGALYASGTYIRVLNQFYQNGGTITVEVSASATAGKMDNAQNLALSIYMGTSSVFTSADAIACNITAGAANTANNGMTAVTISPVTVTLSNRYTYFFLAIRSTGGGGVVDPYEDQPAYCPKLTVRVVGQTNS